MLAKQIKWAFLISLMVQACGQAVTAPLLGAASVEGLLNSQFCQKYKCSIVDGNPDMDSMTVDVVMPGNKYSGRLIGDESKASIEFYFHETSSRITKATVHLGNDYAINRLKPEFAEIVNDFSVLMVQKPLIQNYEYANGGRISFCFSSLGKSQRTGIRANKAKLTIGSISPQDSYLVTCDQPSTKTSIRVNRSVSFQLH